MAQESINYGAFPNDPAANTIRDAFISTQNNFTQLFNSAAANANVARIVAGTGVSIEPANGVGNVTVTANLNSLRVRSNTLTISSLGGYNVGSTVVIPDANATLLIDIDSRPNSNSSVYNLEVIGNLNLSGSSFTAATANINLTSGNITLGSGRISGKFAVAGGSGAVQYSDTSGIQTGTGSFNFDIANSRLNVPGITTTQITAANANIVSGNFNALVTNTFTASNVTITTNLLANAASFSANVLAQNFVGNLAGNLTTNTLSNTIVFYNSSGVSTGSANLRYVAGNLELLNGAIICSNFTGNLNGTASMATAVVGSVQANISQLGNLSLLNVTGTALVNSLTANVTLTAPQANLANANVTNTLTSNNISATRANIQTDLIADTLTANNSVTAANVTASLGLFSNKMTANAGVFVAQATPPSSPIGGTVYYNGTTGKLQVYNGVLSVWQDLN